jgi:hypothetical protein
MRAHEPPMSRIAVPFAEAPMRKGVSQKMLKATFFLHFFALT